MPNVPKVHLPSPSHWLPKGVAVHAKVPQTGVKKRPWTHILALTDEVEFVRLLRSILQARGCKVSVGVITNKRTGANEPADIVILDLESVDLELAARARRTYAGAQIIAICSKYREADCIAILEMDVDYLPRPFRGQDLAARVRAAELRRFRAEGRRRLYRHGCLAVDLFERTVALDGELIALAPSDLNVLIQLARKPGFVATFGEILTGIGRGESARARRSIHLSVFRLRRRIERDPKHPILLLTETGIGYRLVPESVDHLNFEARTPQDEGNGAGSP